MCNKLESVTRFQAAGSSLKPGIWTETKKLSHFNITVGTVLLVNWSTFGVRQARSLQGAPVNSQTSHQAVTREVYL